MGAICFDPRTGVAVEVENTGSRSGEEVVQLYMEAVQLYMRAARAAGPRPGTGWPDLSAWRRGPERRGRSTWRCPLASFRPRGPMAAAWWSLAHSKCRSAAVNSLTKLVTIGGELQVVFSSRTLRRHSACAALAAACNQPKRAALSEHDAEFQDLLVVRHLIVDSFHFVSFHDRGWDRRPNGLQSAHCKQRGLLARWCERLGQLSQPLLSPSHTPLVKPAGRTSKPMRKCPPHCRMGRIKKRKLLLSPPEAGDRNFGRLAGIDAFSGESGDRLVAWIA